MPSKKPKPMPFEDIERIGIVAFGPRWIAPMARALARETGRKIEGPAINHWKSGLRPVPPWVEAAMLKVVNTHISAGLEEARNLRLLSNELEDRLLGALRIVPAPVKGTVAKNA